MLSVLCLSLVPVLRCVALKRIELSALLIPPGIELFFSIALLFNRSDTRGRFRYLLCAEGISYFLLALMEFFAHTIPVLYQDLSVFKLVDIILGGLSFAPLLCFTLWFFFMAQQELVYIVPVRIRKPTDYVLIGCIPPITISHIIGAFLGISYRTLNDVNIVGFIDERAQLLWSFFNMFSLALLAIFEVVAFLLLLARLIKVIRHKRRKELANGTGEVHHFRGIILMNLGMLLSLVETFIGFAHQSFILGITRRGTKTVGRALIILGLLRGWDYLEDVRFMMQEPSKSKRISRMSIRQLFPNIPSSGDGTRTSERGSRRVSVRYPRGRAPTLHLRLSEFDISPVMRALRSPTRSPNSIHTHLIPETTQTKPTVGEFSEGYLDPGYPHHRSAPSNVPTSPITPNSPWTVTWSTPGVSPSSDQTTNPQLHHPTHTREDTMSSTVSNLQVEVMTLSGSPPDPGFVLPIPSRSWGRRSLNLLLANTAQPEWLGHTEDTPVDYGHHQIAQATTPMDENDFVLTPLEPPRIRQPSWISESSVASSAVISTATRLTRANTVASATSVVIRHTPGVVSNDNVHTGQRSTVTNEHPLGNPLSTARVERSGGTV